MNFSPLAAEIGSVVWDTPANSNRFLVLAPLLQRRRSYQRKPTKLCTVFGRLLGWYTTHTFTGALVP